MSRLRVAPLLPGLLVAALTLAPLSPALAGAPVCDDNDADGFEDTSCGGDDCDDTDDSVFPGAEEACDGVDSDCDGLPDGAELSIGATAVPAPAPYTATPFRQIPDQSLLEELLPVNEPGALIADLDVLIEIFHDLEDDLVVTVTSPAGTEVELVANVGGAGSNFNDTLFDDEAATAIEDGSPPFTGSFSPQNPLSAFDGEEASGTWVVSVEDTVFNFSNGIWNSFELRLSILQADDADGDGWLDNCAFGGDCDGTDPGVYPGAPEVCADGIDQDCDGADASQDADFDGDGYISDQCATGDDCDDLDANVNPGVDVDNDGSHACADCDDDESLVLPGAFDVCDGLDNDCNGTPDDGDNDGDGSTACLDCDDNDATVSPDLLEICDDGLDQDCDGSDLVGDNDGDGFLSEGCVGGDDCSDIAADIHPGAEEACDGLDRNCDGLAEVVDDDGDGWFDAGCGGLDCDDGRGDVHPDAVELCSGVDDNCNGLFLDADGVDADDDAGSEADADNDGVRLCDGDCDDTDAALQAPEDCQASGDDDDLGGDDDDSVGGCSDGCAVGSGSGSSHLVAVLLLLLAMAPGVLARRGRPEAR